MKDKNAHIKIDKLEHESGRNRKMLEMFAEALGCGIGFYYGIEDKFYNFSQITKRIDNIEKLFNALLESQNLEIHYPNSELSIRPKDENMKRHGLT